MNRLVLLVGVPVAGLAAACGGTSSSGAPASSGGAATAPSATPAAVTSVATGSTSLGTVLTDPASGKTLYYFTPEKGGTVACTGGCASTWPALLVSGTPAAPSGVSGMLSTVAVTGGMELTYNGWPLHTYAGDSAAGQTNGQGIAGKWFAATPGLTTNGNGSGGAPASASPSNPYGGY